jgi:ABC-2 type transport system permease protein
MAPGVIGMGSSLPSIFSGIGLLWDRQFGFLKETLVAPVPRLHIMMGRRWVAPPWRCSRARWC